MKRILIGILMTLLLSSCASQTAKNIGPNFLTDLAVANKQAEEKCFEAWETSFKVDCDGMDSRDCGYVKMQAENRKMMMEVAGKGTHPCYNPDNLWSFMSKEVQEMNATFRSVGGNALDLGKWLVGGEVVKTGLKNMGDHTSQSVGGDGSPSSSSTRSTSTESAGGGIGEGAQGGSTGGGSGFVDPGVAPIVPTTDIPVAEVTN